MGLSPLRKGLLWWFAPPASPWVSVLLAVDVAPAQAWLAERRAREGERAPGLHHLVAGAIARKVAVSGGSGAGGSGGGGGGRAVSNASR